MISLKRMHVSARLIIAGVSVLIGLVLIAGYTLTAIRSDALAAHSQRIKHLVEISKGVIANYQALEEAHQLTREAAQLQAKGALRSLRFGDDDYFFLYDFDGRGLVTKDAKGEGDVFLGKTDTTGFKLWDEIVGKGKTGEGYIEYVFPRAGQTESLPKLGYVVGIPEWQWIVGTGVYIDDVEQAVKKAAFSYGLMSLMVLAVLAVIMLLVSRSIVTQLGGEPQDAAERLKKIADGDLSEEIVLENGDTTSLLASLKQMQEGLKRLVGEIAEIVHAASQGDFSRRLALGDKQGFGKEISEGLNRLVETTDVGLKDTTRVCNALAVGDLSQTITRDYPGLFGQMKTGVNGTVTALTRVMDEIRRIVEAANRGDFSIQPDLAGKQGFARDIAQLLSQLLATTEVGLKDVMRVAKALAEGDLSQTIDREHPGLFGETTVAINTTVSNLKDLIGQIKASADTINTAAREIAVGNADLSQRTEEQASSLEETASSMEELTSTVKQNADNARQANLLANSAREVAAMGGEKVREAVTSMSAITASSEKIADIIGVIDGIAFQTNILALNAAVEAARAGEQGRGFAVVAAEVRALAQRSAAASKEIKTLIHEDSATIATGSKQIREAGETMVEIVTQVKRVSDIIAEISAASDEQTTGIEQINQAIVQMDDVTQQNASLVEEAAAAAESMEEQAQSLARAVSLFRVDERVGGINTASASLPAVARPSPVRASPASKRPPVVARQANKAPVKLGRSDDEWEEF